VLRCCHGGTARVAAKRRQHRVPVSLSLGTVEHSLVAHTKESPYDQRGFAIGRPGVPRRSFVELSFPQPCSFPTSVTTSSKAGVLLITSAFAILLNNLTTRITSSLQRLISNLVERCLSYSFHSPCRRDDSLSTAAPLLPNIIV
jgi:hypothetical protein